MRSDVTFRSGTDDCAAWLYTPQVSTGSWPIIVMAHGLGGVREHRLDAFAERFVAAGYGCVVFDYRHFGASGGAPRQLLDIAAQLDDWRAAVDFARTLDGVDAERVILWGTSFSGGHVIVTAAKDRRIAAVISQCPFTDGIASSLAANPATSLRLTVKAIADLAASWRGREPVTVATYGPPGSLALMTAPDVVAGVERLIPPGFEGRNDIAARFAFSIIGTRPGKHAKDVACPIFFAICEHDSVAPPGPSQRYAAQAPNAEIRLYDAGHFDLYVDDTFETNIADQLAFLAHHVPT